MATNDMNFELKFAKHWLDELEQYIPNPTDDAYQQLSDDMKSFVQNQNPMLQWLRLKIAIELDKYRPRNMPILDFANNPDLAYTGGQFDTFNPTLAKLMKAKKFDDARNMLGKNMPNMSTLSAINALNWIKRLQKYPDQIQAAKNASPENEFTAYQELLWTITDDFVNFYNLRNDIGTPILYADLYPDCDDKPLTRGICKIRHTNDNMPHVHVDIYLKNIKNLAKKYNDTVFNTFIITLAHELSHALDNLQPSKTALGAQIMYYDNKTYKPAPTSEYLKSATEINAFHLEDIVKHTLENNDY